MIVIIKIKNTNNSIRNMIITITIYLMGISAGFQNINLIGMVYIHV
jgi:hypothetical protein